jgi:hypothetical protein
VSTPQILWQIASTVILIGLVIQINRSRTRSCSKPHVSWSSETDKQLLTDREHRVMEQIRDLHDNLLTVVGHDKTRTNDLNELFVHLHAIQRSVMAQASARAYPEKYRLLGESFR